VNVKDIVITDYLAVLVNACRLSRHGACVLNRTLALTARGTVIRRSPWPSALDPAQTCTSGLGIIRPTVAERRLQKHAGNLAIKSPIFAFEIYMRYGPPLAQAHW
jgi:hypothetical protein